MNCYGTQSFKIVDKKAYHIWQDEGAPIEYGDKYHYLGSGGDSHLLKHKKTNELYEAHTLDKEPLKLRRKDETIPELKKYVKWYYDITLDNNLNKMTEEEQGIPNEMKKNIFGEAPENYIKRLKAQGLTKDIFHKVYPMYKDTNFYDEHTTKLLSELPKHAAHFNLSSKKLKDRMPGYNKNNVDPRALNQHTRQQAFYKGFKKRASEYGLNEAQALQLYKTANFNVDNL